MPKTVTSLTVKKIESLNSPGLYAVGGAQGLHLQVSGSEAKSWVLRLTVGTRVNSEGKRVQHRRDFGLGSFPKVPLGKH
jgi:hypothetical protein